MSVIDRWGVSLEELTGATLLVCHGIDLVAGSAFDKPDAASNIFMPHSGSTFCGIARPIAFQHLRHGGQAPDTPGERNDGKQHGGKGW